MARDDEDDERPRKKSPRDDEGEEEDDRPRKKSSHDDEDDDSSGKKSKPMPMRLVGAIIAALAWSILILHASCLNSSSLIVEEIHNQKAQREADENLRKMQEQMRAAGVNQKIDMGDRGNGVRYTIVGTKIFLFLMATLLLVGGVTLLMRKGFGKYLAMGAPVGMLLVEFVGFVTCLIITKGTFLAQHNVVFLVNILFSLVVGGCIVFLLLNKDVNRALK
jgi:hypothetical protein